MQEKLKVNYRTIWRIRLMRAYLWPLRFFYGRYCKSVNERGIFSPASTPSFTQWLGFFYRAGRPVKKK